MKRKNITRWSEQAIAAGILDFALAKYESAEQHFENVVRDIEGRGDRFKRYLWTASFGQGLAQGMSERQVPTEPRSISEVAAAAKSFYDVFASFGEKPPNVAKYRCLGKNYAALGLEEEGVKVLDMSRYSDILNIYRLYRAARDSCLGKAGER